MYKEVDAKLEGTIFEAKTDENGNVLWYRISPANGYKLHEVTLDEIVVDENGNETGEIKKGFTKSYVTAGASYDFSENKREIYAEVIENEC